YGLDDVARACALIRAARIGEAVAVAPGVTARFRDAGHILGSASILIEAEGRRVCFSGDVGMPGRPILRDPEPAPECDALVLESTYGDRDHPPPKETDDSLCEVLGHAARDGGAVLVPAFAVGRAQEVLYRLRTLSDENRLLFPNVYLDSPMATRVTQLFRAHPESLDDEAHRRLQETGGLFRMPELHVVESREASQKLNDDPRPKIIVAASGMCNGGPIRHHLRHHLWRPEADVLFVGYQAEGTLGRRILAGARRVTIHGRAIAVNARVRELPGLSAHADRGGLVAWARSARKPARVFLNHGEPPAALALSGLLGKELGWSATVPARGESFQL
ncbi:MAG: MBL fold metallo-hydrolase RNA specificity domain-containing protein, partial [Planctomycetota bacterium]